MVRALCILAMVGSLTTGLDASGHGAPEQAPEDFPHVRSSDRTLAALIDTGREQSPTFRTLIEGIETSDGLVYVQPGRCPGRIPACLNWQLTDAGEHRYLFISMEMSRSEIDLIASIGHELQHALEVLNEQSIRTAGAMALYYIRGMTPETPRPVETRAAVEAGNAVFRELREHRRRR